MIDCGGILAYFAHSKNEQGNRHDLVDHLQEVARLTQEFASAFDAAELGYYLGLWHDLGKFHPDWQAKLLAVEQTKQSVGIDHKAAGVSILRRQSGNAGLSALVLQGHHGGLRTVEKLKQWSNAINNKGNAPEESIALAEQVIYDLSPAAPLLLPAFIKQDRQYALRFELFLRMLFSALVDADITDTQHHKDATLVERRGGNLSLDALWERLTLSQAAFGEPTNSVNQARSEIYEASVRAAEQSPGLFRLTVPTGGGKTRSGMAFALRHALQHGMERIIVAVPYMTITEQTAQVYRDIFEKAGDHVVLEHHSGAVEREDDEIDGEASWQRLAAENWDAPIVVTTTVQLFESLFANQTSRCRKLHRLARSVIILDEAQTLPVKLLTPILDVVTQLSENYGSSVVLSTATQPAWEAISILGNTVAREIVPQPERFFTSLKRVEYDWSRSRTPQSWAEIADLLHDESQALVVLNTKQDALDLLDALNDPHAMHLSTLLCGSHRKRVIDEVKRRLVEGEPCRLIATQVVEAGVDIDFPLVLRAMGPLDSIIQAAGRANREGGNYPGRVVIFETEQSRMPPGPYTIATNQSRLLLRDGDLDPDDFEVLREYFELYYSAVGAEGRDVKEIQTLRRDLNYPEVSKQFRMIDQSVNVVIPTYGTVAEQRKVEELLTQFRAYPYRARAILRQLQPYFVSLRYHKAKGLWQQNLIESLPDSNELTGVGIWLGDYDVSYDLIGGRGLVEKDRQLTDWVI